MENKLKTNLSKNPHQLKQSNIQSQSFPSLVYHEAMKILVLAQGEASDVARQLLLALLALISLKGPQLWPQI